MSASVLLALCALLPLLAWADDSSPTSTAAQTSQTVGSNGVADNPVDPNTAGASGSDNSAFSLSRGALGAIIAVAVVVVVLGVGSAVLFWLAKKRQWNVRQSISRVSRRLTGRSGAANNRQKRGTAVRLSSPAARSRANRDPDLEKGVPSTGPWGKTTTTVSSAPVTGVKK